MAAFPRRRHSPPSAPRVTYCELADVALRKVDEGSREERRGVPVVRDIASCVLEREGMVVISAGREDVKESGDPAPRSDIAGLS